MGLPHATALVSILAVYEQITLKPDRIAALPHIKVFVQIVLTNLDADMKIINNELSDTRNRAVISTAMSLKNEVRSLRQMVGSLELR